MWHHDPPPPPPPHPHCGVSDQRHCSELPASFLSLSVSLAGSSAWLAPGAAPSLSPDSFLPSPDACVIASLLFLLGDPFNELLPWRSLRDFSLGPALGVAPQQVSGRQSRFLSLQVSQHSWDSLFSTWMSHTHTRCFVTYALWFIPESDHQTHDSLLNLITRHMVH